MKNINIDGLLQALKELSKESNIWDTYSVKLKLKGGLQRVGHELYEIDIEFIKFRRIVHGNDVQIIPSKKYVHLEKLPTDEGIKKLERYIDIVKRRARNKRMYANSKLKHKIISTLK